MKTEEKENAPHYKQHKQTNSNRYKALNPNKNLPVHRDPVGDGTFHYNVNSGNGQGINIHRGHINYSPNSPGSGVNGYSAGCQVIHYYVDWLRFIGLCEEYEYKVNNTFYYTLINAADFK